MRILIVSATLDEIKPSLPFLNDHQIDYLITGVGMVATAFELGQFLQQKSYDLLINVGIAGAFSDKMNLGDVVRVVEDQFFELGAEDQDNYLSIEELGFGKSIYRENIPYSIENILAVFPKVNGITVNKVHGKSESIVDAKKRISESTVESMEGAGVFYAAERLQVPVLQIRAISNYVEPRNKSNWNISLALRQLNSRLILFLENFV
ncbi:futalosine hydrolase [Sphingobacterium hungaricum]|uniref:Futalosine hydrolase n=1 Tax=Sphingobacterium hungaricum TaxID=2082723 RepID=A0A928YPT6_9SPHI|nr:futalosine hydrolase [Sphingobacterium hungaricum]MBE8712902.1 futalosine hydrolase [Sphingobacterium hungaricum]